jgi:hypothetical protein
MARPNMRWGRDSAPIVLSIVGGVTAVAVVALLVIAVLVVPWG